MASEDTHNSAPFLACFPPSCSHTRRSLPRSLLSHLFSLIRVWNVSEQSCLALVRTCHKAQAFALCCLCALSSRRFTRTSLPWTCPRLAFFSPTTTRNASSKCDRESFQKFNQGERRTTDIPHGLRTVVLSRQEALSTRQVVRGCARPNEGHLQV